MIKFLYIYLFFCSILNASDLKINDHITITSKKVQIIKDKNLIIFIDNVKATQKEISLFADKMIINYIENSNNKTEIKKIKAENNVKFIKENIIVTGKDGYFIVDENKIILKENIVAIENEVKLFADEFHYDTKTGKSNLIGKKDLDERVTIILN